MKPLVLLRGNYAIDIASPFVGAMATYRPADGARIGEGGDHTIRVLAEAAAYSHRPGFYWRLTDVGVARARIEAEEVVMTEAADVAFRHLQRPVSRTVVFGELDWSPACHEQCIGRVFRHLPRSSTTNEKGMPMINVTKEVSKSAKPPSAGALNLLDLKFLPGDVVLSRHDKTRKLEVIALSMDGDPILRDLGRGPNDYIWRGNPATLVLDQPRNAPIAAKAESGIDVSTPEPRFVNSQRVEIVDSSEHKGIARFIAYEPNRIAARVSQRASVFIVPSAQLRDATLRVGDTVAICAGGFAGMRGTIAKIRSLSGDVEVDLSNHGLHVFDAETVKLLGRRTEESPPSARPEEKQPERFFLVWRPEGGIPTRRQQSLAKAVSEAERVAQKHPGDRVYLLKAEAQFRASTPVVERRALAPTTAEVGS